MSICNAEHLFVFQTKAYIHYLINYIILHFVAYLLPKVLASFNCAFSHITWTYGINATRYGNNRLPPIDRMTVSPDTYMRTR